MQMAFTGRDCNIETDNDDDNPENEVMFHYNKFHKKLINRCKKCMQKL